MLNIKVALSLKSKKLHLPMKNSQNIVKSKIQINYNKINTRFKIRARCYLDLLTPETMKLLGSTKSKITKNKNGENVSKLEIIVVILVHCDIFNNNY